MHCAPPALPSQPPPLPPAAGPTAPRWREGGAAPAQLAGVGGGAERAPPAACPGRGRGRVEEGRPTGLGTGGSAGGADVGAVPPRQVLQQTAYVLMPRMWVGTEAQGPTGYGLLGLLALPESPCLCHLRSEGGLRVRDIPKRKDPGNGEGGVGPADLVPAGQGRVVAMPHTRDLREAVVACPGRP